MWLGRRKCEIWFSTLFLGSTHSMKLVQQLNFVLRQYYSLISCGLGPRVCYNSELTCDIKNVFLRYSVWFLGRGISLSWSLSLHKKTQTQKKWEHKSNNPTLHEGRMKICQIPWKDFRAKKKLYGTQFMSAMLVRSDHSLFRYSICHSGTNSALHNLWPLTQSQHWEWYWRDTKENKVRRNTREKIYIFRNVSFFIFLYGFYISVRNIFSAFSYIFL
jgi:hypothetical protein